MKEFGAASSTGGEEVQPLLEKDILLIHDRSLSFLLKLTTEDGKMPASEDSRFRHDFGRDLMECAYFIAEANRQEPVTDLGRHFLPQLWQRTKQAVFKFWETNQLPIGQLPHEVKPYNEKDANNPFFH